MWPIGLLWPDVYVQFIRLTKQLFSICLISMSQWWTPIDIYVTEDESCKGLFSLRADETLDSSRMGDRAIVISNHQLYTDWIYLWWFSYTARAHDGITIILKESLKWLPVLGWGMQHFKFIFLSRKWAKDEKVLDDNLGRLNKDVNSPCWLLLFPEGTTFSANGVIKSRAYSEKAKLRLPQHVLLPRARGFRHALLRLNETVEYMYDATFYYDGIPDGVYGEEYFTLRRTYFEAHYVKSAHVHWRRFRVKDIPFLDEQEFEKWILDRWYEKDELLERFKTTGSFLVDDDDSAKRTLKTHVELKNPFEILQIFSPPLNVVLIIFILFQCFK